MNDNNNDELVKSEVNNDISVSESVIEETINNEDNNLEINVATENSDIETKTLENKEELNDNKLEEKKVKKNIILFVISILFAILIGMIAGFYIIKGLNEGVKNDSFMHDVLSNTGLLINNTIESEDNNTDTPYATSCNYDYASNSNATFSDLLTYIQSDEYYDYYYYTTPSGDNLYYYSSKGYGEQGIINYYASDSDGHYKKIKYMDYIMHPSYFTVPDYTKYDYKELIDEWDTVTLYYVRNSNYEEGKIYFQSEEAGSKMRQDQDGYLSRTITLLVNADEPTE